MNRAIEALGDRLIAPAPAERLGVLRLLVAGYATAYLAARLPLIADEAALPDHRWEPVGPLAALGGPPPAGFVLAAGLVALAAGVGATVGWRFKVTGPVFALLTLLLLTYANSWGLILHTEHLVVLHLLVLGASPAAAAWSLDARRSAATAPPGPGARYGFPVRLISLVTVCTYALAGWAKLRSGGWAWLDGDVLRNQVAFDNVRKAVLGSPWSPLGGWLVSLGWIWRPLAVATVAVELGAPLVLFVRRLRAWWAWSAWGFHLGVLVVMAILFPYPLSGVAFASLFAVERLPAAAGRRARRVLKPRTPATKPGLAHERAGRAAP